MEQLAETEAYKELGAKLITYDDECDKMKYPRYVSHMLIEQCFIANGG